MADGMTTVRVQMHLADAILRVLVPGGWVSMHELRAQVGKIVDMREHESALLVTVNAMEMERVIETRGRHKGGFSVRLTRKAGG
jgi:hypothetical protein